MRHTLKIQYGQQPGLTFYYGCQETFIDVTTTVLNYSTFRSKTGIVIPKHVAFNRLFWRSPSGTN